MEAERMRKDGKTPLIYSIDQSTQPIAPTNQYSQEYHPNYSRPFEPQPFYPKQFEPQYPRSEQRSTGDPFPIIAGYSYDIPENSIISGDITVSGQLPDNDSSTGQIVEFFQGANISTLNNASGLQNLRIPMEDAAWEQAQQTFRNQSEVYRINVYKFQNKQLSWVREITR
jgi:hypothetical protein